MGRSFLLTTLAIVVSTTVFAGETENNQITAETIQANFELCSTENLNTDGLEVVFHSDTEYALVKKHDRDFKELLAYSNCLAGSNVRRVDVYVMPFNMESSLKYPRLLELQIMEKWDDAKYGAAYKSFYGYTYTDSDVIQMRPTVLDHYYTVNPLTGYRNLPTGGFFGQLGHEMLHVVLMSVGFPEKDQHCFFSQSHIEAHMLNHLVAKGLFPASMNHTSKLSSERGCQPPDPRHVKKVKKEK